MKKIYILLAAVTLTACGTQKVSTEKTATSTTIEEKINAANQIDGTLDIGDSYAKDASGNLTGVVQKDAFMQAPYNSWFNSSMEIYEADQETIDALKLALKDVEIRAYMGTWCGDSKRETPQFYNILEAAYFDMDQLTMITVDRSKKRPVNLVSDYNIQRVPTFIFYRNGTEIGRYVERPRESLEKDMLKIVTGQEYKHSYDN
jgi:thiol-disulfide isomerase/thioredoxin